MIIRAFLLASLIVSSLLLAPVPSQAAVNSQGGLNNATVTANVDLPSLMSRKNYRLGLRGGMLSPSDSVNLNKDSAYCIGLDFDAKLNENFDMGPRFTYLSKTLNAGLVNATYGVLMFGFGGRVYVTYFGDYGSTHGYFNAYISLDGNYCAASKSADLATSPASFAGFMGSGGLGLELAFGPNATGFIEAKYQKSAVKDASGIELPLDGININFGTRLAFI